MADYHNPGGYPPPPGSGGYNNYPHPPQPQQPHGEYGAPGYTSSPAATQSPYIPAYRPPQEDQYQYSPRSSGLQVGQYTGDEYVYNRERRNSGPWAASQYRSSDGGYYPSPPRYDDRPTSRGSWKERESDRSRDRSRDRGEKKDHSTAKDIGATLLGGVVGTLAGRKLGHHDDLVTVAGALAGAYAGHKLEGKREKSKEKKRDRRRSQSFAPGDSYDGDYDYEPRRSVSRRRSGTGAGTDIIVTIDEDFPTYL
ncbi:hypothetical protein KCU88_g471, partial [Aureobasidium melanogenum]